jgi:hypothetical protein
MIEKLMRKWCSLMHGIPTRPINGKYRCRECLREYAVNWAIPRVHSQSEIDAALAKIELVSRD